MSKNWKTTDWNGRGRAPIGELVRSIVTDEEVTILGYHPVSPTLTFVEKSDGSVKVMQGHQFRPTKRKAEIVTEDAIRMLEEIKTYEDEVDEDNGFPNQEWSWEDYIAALSNAGWVIKPEGFDNDQ